MAKTARAKGGARMKWLSIKDHVPEPGQKVLYYFKPLGMFIGTYTKADPEYGKHCFSGKSGWLIDDVTHWMPLPKEPTE